MVQQSSIKRALTSSKEDKWPKRTSDPLCPLTASTWARERGSRNFCRWVGGGGGGEGMQVHLTQTSLTILFRGDKGGGGGGVVLNVFSEGSNDLFQRKI